MNNEIETLDLEKEQNQNSEIKLPQEKNEVPSPKKKFSLKDINIETIKNMDRRQLIVIGVVALIIIFLISKIFSAQNNGPSIYNITFNPANGDEVTTVTANRGTTLIRPTDPQKKGYTFRYWGVNGQEFDFSSPVMGNMELVAEWEEGVYVTINFRTETGTFIPSRVVKAGTVLERPEDPVRPGYRFVRWQWMGEEFDFSSKVYENMNITAIWKQIALEEDELREQEQKQEQEVPENSPENQ